MKVIFISAPFTAPTQWGIVQNIREAEYMARLVWSEDAVAVCPHLNSGIFFGLLDEDAVLAGYEELVIRCDAMWVHRNWLKSNGCKREFAVAQAVGLPIFHTWEETQRYLTC